MKPNHDLKFGSLKQNNANVCLSLFIMARTSYSFVFSRFLAKKRKYNNGSRKIDKYFKQTKSQLYLLATNRSFRPYFKHLEEQYRIYCGLLGLRSCHGMFYTRLIYKSISARNIVFRKQSILTPFIVLA